jgi:hypothetical protein
MGYPIMRRVPTVTSPYDGAVEGGGPALAASQIVTYRVDDETTVDIEIEPVGDYLPAGVGDVVGRVRTAAQPAVKAARALLDEVKELAPDDIQVTFGVKVSGTTSWILARASTEGNFEVTLSWRPAGS